MSFTNAADLTPLMRQYFDIKRNHPDTLLLFQVGDFYELFFDDAKKVAAFLSITLTKRGKISGEPIPLCGVPVHAVDQYVARLVKGGFKVALCDQLHEAVPGKVVERGVTSILTPGTLTDSALLNQKAASYLFSFFPMQEQWGLVFAELMTAQLFATVLPAQNPKTVDSELIRFFPDEIVLPNIQRAKPFETLFKANGYFITLVADSFTDEACQWAASRTAHSTPDTHQQVIDKALINFYNYVQPTQKEALAQFKQVTYYNPEDFLVLDRATQHNLEIVTNSADGTKTNTLFQVLDGARTAMGSRMIKKWIMRPLVKQAAIEQRLQAVEHFVTHSIERASLEQLLGNIGDIERIIGRIALKRATVQDYLQLKHALQLIPHMRGMLADVSCALIKAIAESLTHFSELHLLLEQALHDDSASSYLIKKGYDAELDQMRDVIEHSTQKIIELEQAEQRATKINSLKVRYNSIQGYYIEVTKTHLDAIPSHYVRQQTLVGKERYTTPELDQMQQSLQRAHNQINAHEKELYELVKKRVAQEVSALRRSAHAIANLDALVGFARISDEYGYVKPTFNVRSEFCIKNGRHPVVERSMEHAFIPNDTYLTDSAATWIITGPNMGGKSTYLRQVGLMSIMAQVGMFVPAQSACLPLVDRIFTRIGAGDDLATGKSTFLVEMEETATICASATNNSLVILDEVGRGTSTFDGLAIAQAVVEYIHTVLKARCLFATHYHELTALEQHHAGIVSYHAASQKTAQGIQFLYKMIPGAAPGSYGIDVARLAQLPEPIIKRACMLLAELQQTQPHQTSVVDPSQLLTQEVAVDPLATRLKEIDFDSLSPKQALDILWRWKEIER